jgi:hypothetical protein
MNLPISLDMVAQKTQVKVKENPCKSKLKLSGHTVFSNSKYLILDLFQFSSLFPTFSKQPRQD